ncbi:MAG: T9SS type A sorting domain-containing protein [Candidatus Zixiibacteriota bacterium]
MKLKICFSLITIWMISGLGFAQEISLAENATALYIEASEASLEISEQMAAIRVDWSQYGHGNFPMAENGCINVEMSITDSVIGNDPISPEMVRAYLELTNCGDVPSLTFLDFTITITISYIIDTTIHIPSIPVYLDSGQTLTHECVFPAPSLNATVTICAYAYSGVAQDYDCATITFVDNDSPGIPIEAQGLLIQQGNCLLFAPAGDSLQLYELENYGEFEDGDTVIVSGYLDIDCETDCTDASGCISGNTITLAPTTNIYFENCGMLINSNGCLLFYPINNSGYIYYPADSLYFMALLLENYGDYQEYDSVYVRGNLSFSNDTLCGDAVGVLLDNTIELCDQWPPTPFSGCGLLFQGVECVLFSPFDYPGASYVLGNLGTFRVGDTVNISGLMIPDCESYCMQGNGCIVENTIAYCNSNPPDSQFYSGCGQLVPYDNCIAFMSWQENWPNYYILENYGVFSVWDTVFVSGLLDGYTVECSLQTVPFLSSNMIEYCGQPPLDSLYYSGCGMLIPDSNCLYFQSFDNLIPLAILNDLGLFGAYDTVIVSGYYIYDCRNSCDNANTVCMMNNTISSCPENPTIPFSGCGLLAEIGNCLLFYPEVVDTLYMGGFAAYAFQLDNYGTFGNGDTVFVNGLIDFNCSNICSGSFGCIIDNIIDTCSLGPVDTLYYSGCGILTAFGGCIAFTGVDNPGAEYYFLEHYGGFTIGDTVLVGGLIDGYTDACSLMTMPYISGNTIENCGFPPVDTLYYSGCGILTAYDNCIAFTSIENPWNEFYILENYGSFSINDTVLVNGLIDGYTDLCSLQTLPFISNNTIEDCGFPPVNDSIFYSGCGILLDDTGCILFYTGLYDIPRTLLANYGDYEIGDSVFVEGWFNFDGDGCNCYGIDYPCLNNNLISVCGGDNPVSDTITVCGILAEGTNCTIFYPDFGDSLILTFGFLLDNYGAFNIYDTVYVSGIINYAADIALDCPEAMAAINVNYIDYCANNPPDTILGISQIEISNSPNPFNPVTTFKFELPKPSRVTLTIFNVLGQKVATVINNEMLSGNQEVNWNGKQQASGIYFYRLDTDYGTTTRKMSLIK